MRPAGVDVGVNVVLLGARGEFAVIKQPRNFRRMRNTREAHRTIAGSRFVELPRAAHFPHLEDPEGLADAIREFIETTDPAYLDDADWGAVIASRFAPRRQRRRAAA